MKKVLISLLIGLLALAPAVEAQLSPRVLSVILASKPVPQLPGNQAFRFRAAEITTLKTNIAGSTQVTTPGDTVGMWVDGSGSGYTVAAAADDTTRPLYQVRSGKGFVQSDGLNDLLYSTTSPNLFGASGGNDYTICIAFRWASPAGGKTIIDESDANSTNTIGSYIRSVSATPANMSASMRGSDGATNIVTATNSFIANANDGNDHVLCYVKTGTTLTPYLDGVASANQTVTNTAWTVNQLNIFARYRARTSAPGVNIDAFAALDLYTAVAWKSNQTAAIAQITQVLDRDMP